MRQKISAFVHLIRNKYVTFLALHGVRERGHNNTVYGKVDIVNSRNLVIGSDCTINHGVYINAFNPIKIGDDVTISAHSVISSTGIDYAKWGGGMKCHLVNDGIVIGSHVWIGADAKIIGQVKITGSYVVVAAGAVVTKDIVDSRVVVAGCPAKTIKRF